MSPGCATTLRLTSGETIFLKAVGTDLNEATTALFRQEIATLRCLPTAPYRLALVDAFDDGEWVAIALEAFDGTAPTLDDDSHFAAALEIIDAQAGELTPPPEGLRVPTLGQYSRRWVSRWAEIRTNPGFYLPAWAVDRLGELANRVNSLPDRLASTTLCHFDIRDDNLLINSAGRVAVVDWGMARFGPIWADLAMLAWQRSSAEDADGWLRRLIGEEDQEVVTDVVLAFAGSQSWNARQPERQNLPTMAAFCRDDARRLFALAARRLEAAG